MAFSRRGGGFGLARPLAGVVVRYRHVQLVCAGCGALCGTVVATWWILYGVVLWLWLAAGCAAAGLTLIVGELVKVERVLEHIAEGMSRGELAHAVTLCDKFLEQGPSKRARAATLELKARALIGQERPLLALQATLDMPDGFEASAPLRGALMLFEGRAEEARELLEPAYRRDPDDGIASVLSEAYLQCGQLDEAAQAVLASDKIGQPVYAQLETSLLSAGAFAQAAMVSERAFKRFKVADHAYNAACALCQLGELDGASGWLRRAARAGYADVEHLEADRDLELLRDDPRFAELLVEMRDEAGRSAQWLGMADDPCGPED